MTKELKWRLGKLPTPQEVSTLINDKVITKDEARDILFRTEDIEEKSNEDLKSEIKFLKEVIEKLSNHQYSRIVEVIKEVRVPYYTQPWYGPYNGWTTFTCGSNSTSGVGASYTTTGATSPASGAINCAFTSIG